MTLALVLVAGGPAGATAPGRPSYRPGAVLLGFHGGVTPARRRAIAAAYGRVARTIGPVTVLRVRRGHELAVVRALRRRSEVRYAEPDYEMRVAATPNDPDFAQQWAPADDETTAAWQLTTGTASVVVGVLDTGVQYTHPDLAANVWSNPGGVGGCPAGTHGFNVVTAADSCNPMDDDTVYGGHGTHVAGILGAVGNNATGVTGVNWTTTILPVKVADSNGWASTSNLLAGIDRLIQAKDAGVNVRVANDSITTVGTPFSQPVSDAIDRMGAKNILLTTAAGNTGDDNDDLALRRYPCGYDRPNELCVAAGNQAGRLPDWANYGDQTVDLAAPGDHVFSTLRNSNYGYVDGSSMAAPQVAGAAALVLSRAPDMTATALKAALLDSVDRLPALDGLVRTGGRLNVCRALRGFGCSARPNPPAPATFGTTAIGPSADSFAADRKVVNAAALAEAGRLTALRVFLEPAATSGQQRLRGVVYADAGGAPGQLLGATRELVFHAHDDRAWYDLDLPAPLDLSAGRYWLGIISSGTGGVAGFRWQSAAASRQGNADAYANDPADPFGTATADGERMSLYGIYARAGEPAPAPAPPPSLPPPSDQSLASGTGSTASAASTAPPDAGDRAAPSCTATSAVAGVRATPRGRVLAISVPRGRAFDVDVLRETPTTVRRVARLRARRAPFRWTVDADGVYVVRFARAGETRRVVVERRRGRFRIRPAYRLSSTCGTLRLFALSGPVFGGLSARALGASYRLGAAARVDVRVLRAGRTVRHDAQRAVSAGRLVQLRVAAGALGRGDARVVLRVTRAGRTITRTLTARGV